MIRIIYILFLFTIPALANYCIQAVTLDRFDENKISSRLSSILLNFEDARIEERGSYLVLRVGDFNSYSQALADIQSVKRYYSDAYIRKCDFDTSRIIYPDNSTPVEKKSYTHVKNPPSIRRAPKQKPIKRRAYKQPKPQETYYSDTLWQDCQKCFAPIYLEEEESEPENHVTQEVKKTKKPKVITKKKHQTTPKTDDDFWVEAVDNKEDTLDEESEDLYNPNHYPEIDTYQY